jgi:hypothetical protein
MVNGQRLWIALATVFALGSGPPAVAGQTGISGSEQQKPSPSRTQLIVKGRIVEIHAPRVFTVREGPPAGRELLVLAPRPLSDKVAGGTVVVEGQLRRLDAVEQRRNPELAAVEERIRMRFAGRPVLIATSVVAATTGEVARATAEEIAPIPTEPRPSLDEPARDERPLLTVRATTLVGDIEALAGRELRVLNARVVGVLEPDAFLIEPATRYFKPMGERDRVLVVIHDGALRVADALIVGSVVRVVGVVRTLVGMRVAADASWPDRLAAEDVERLEVRAAVLATSVQTAEGVELTDRVEPPVPPRR